MSGWTKREPVQNLVVLGDGPDNRRKVAGLLAGLERDRMYPEKENYRIVQQDGETIVLGGNVTLGRQISAADVGKFIKCAFTGWGKSANGRFKVIEVNVYEGDLSDAMKSWPRYAEVQASLRAAPAPKAQATRAGVGNTPTGRTDEPDFGDDEHLPPALADEDDDLPF